MSASCLGNRIAGSTSLPFRDLLLADPALLDEVRDDIDLVAVHDVRDSQDKDLQG